MDVPLLRLRRWAVAMVAAGCVAATPALAQGVDEAELKAAFVFNFVSFVTWPEAAAPVRELALCVRAGSSSESSLRRLHGTRRGALTISVDVLSSGLEVDRCHVVVADFPESPAGADSGSAQDGLDTSWPAGWWQRPGVLSIGDGGSADTNDVVITLAREEARIRFDIDTGNASEAGLDLSSKLLRLARRVL